MAFSYIDPLLLWNSMKSSQGSTTSWSCRDAYDSFRRISLWAAHRLGAQRQCNRFSSSLCDSRCRTLGQGKVHSSPAMMRNNFRFDPATLESWLCQVLQWRLNQRNLNHCLHFRGFHHNSLHWSLLCPMKLSALSYLHFRKTISGFALEFGADLYYVLTAKGYWPSDLSLSSHFCSFEV